MVFSSTIFLFAFLPAVLGLYFVLRPGLRNALLLASSLLFYAWGEGGFVLLLMASSAVNYVLVLMVGRWRAKAAGKAIVGIAVAINLGFLAWYKYWMFALANFNAVLEAWGASPIAIEPVHLPIGISFFTFQAISYVVDVYRGKTEAQRNPFNVALYIALFPQLIAGPIVRFATIAGEISHRTTSVELFASGVRRFIIGLGKKVLIANTVAIPADSIFGMPPGELTFSLAWIGAICYTLQIYYDFSGYSDMAIGMGRMFGFHFLENFNFPYISRSITDFWRRWHISLSSWFRDYLYIPLGGNRHGAFATYRNLLIVFFLTGLWHGASWNFVVWGLYHGMFLIAERLAAGRTAYRPSAAAAHLYVVAAVVLGWVLFRAENLSHAGALMAAMAGFGAQGSATYYPQVFLEPALVLAVIAGIIGSAPIIPFLAGRLKDWRAARNSTARFAIEGTVEMAGAACLFVVFALSALSLSAQSYNPFIYFRF